MSRLYPERPVVGVGVVVLRPREVLLVRRAREPRKGSWSIPGGAQDLGETLAEAACREVLEETGLSVEIVDQIAVIDSIHRDETGRVRWHYSLIDFVARWTGGEPVAGDDADAAIWAPLDGLGPYELWHETARIIVLAADHPAMRDG